MAAVARPAKAVFGDPASGRVPPANVRRYQVRVGYHWTESDEWEGEIEATSEKEAEQMASRIALDAATGEDAEVDDIEVECLDLDEDGEPLEEVDPTWPQGVPEEQMRLWD